MATSIRWWNEFERDRALQIARGDERAAQRLVALNEYRDEIVGIARLILSSCDDVDNLSAHDLNVLAAGSMELMNVFKALADDAAVMYGD